MGNSPFQISRQIFIAILCAILVSCALISKPDSCSIERLCQLAPAQTEEAIELKIGESKTVPVCACRPWNQSGIQVAEGQQYSFQYKILSAWIDGSVPSDPIGGWQGGLYKTIGALSSHLKRSNKAKWYALVGSVGMDDKNSFAVIESKHGTVTMHKSGMLHFYANDMKGRYFNNKGKLLLQVIREK